MNIIPMQNELTMSTREIADVTGSKHDNVLKTVRELTSRGLISGNETYYVNEQNKQKYPMFVFSYRDTMMIVSGYSAELRAKIIDRWQDLEAQQKPVLTTDQQLLQLAQGVIRLTTERDEAIKTKAHINDKRTATLMNKASQYAKKIKKLESKLQNAGSHLSLTAAKLPQRIDTEYKANVQTWRVLKQISEAMQLDIVKVTDERYGEVNTYHIDVIERFKTEYL